MKEKRQNSENFNYSMLTTVTLPWATNAKPFQGRFIFMHPVQCDYNNYDCFQVGLKKKNSHRKEKSQYSLKEKNISLPCLLDSFWQKAVSSCTTQFNQNVSPERKKRKKKEKKNEHLKCRWWDWEQR